MSISKMFQDMSKYLTEAFARIFGPHEEDMPDIGVQPFDCNPYYKNTEAKS